MSKSLRYEEYWCRPMILKAVQECTYRDDVFSILGLHTLSFLCSQTQCYKAILAGCCFYLQDILVLAIACFFLNFLGFYRMPFNTVSQKMNKKSMRCLWISCNIWRQNLYILDLFYLIFYLNEERILRNKSCKIG